MKLYSYHTITSSDFLKLNPAYVAVALERWSTLTDQQPVKL